MKIIEHAGVLGWRAVIVVVYCSALTWLLFPLMSCGGSGEEGGGVSDDRLVGTWNISATRSSGGGSVVTRSYWYFSEDGKVYSQHIVDDAADRCLYLGTYTFEGDRLAITGTSPYSGSVETLYSGAVEFQGDELIFTDEIKLDGEDWGDRTFEPSTVTPLTEGCVTLVEA